MILYIFGILFQEAFHMTFFPETLNSTPAEFLKKWNIKMTFWLDDKG